MPVADHAEARDLVCAVLNTAWAAQTSPPPLIFEDGRTTKPDHAPYAEAEIDYGDQRGVAIGDSGRKRLRTEARLIVAIHTVPGDGLTMSDALVIIVQDAFEKVRDTAPDKVTFRRVAVVKDGLTGDSFKVRVIVYFDYDRVQSRT